MKSMARVLCIRGAMKRHGCKGSESVCLSGWISKATMQNMLICTFTEKCILFTFLHCIRFDCNFNGCIIVTVISL